MYNDYEKMLNESDIDTVYVAVPNPLHFEFSMQALKAGKHVEDMEAKGYGYLLGLVVER